MVLVRLIPYYIVWHYTRGIVDLFAIWRNFMWFVPNFFSIKTLLASLFSPFERLQENYKKGFNPEDLLGTLVVNTIMRLVGFVLRSFVIVLGIFSYIFTILFGLVALIVWALLPFLVIFLVTLSLLAFFRTS